MLGCPIVQLVVNGTKIYFDFDGGIGRCCNILFRKRSFILQHWLRNFLCIGLP